MLPGALQVKHFGASRLREVSAREVRAVTRAYIFSLFSLDELLAEEDDEVPLSRMQLRNAQQARVMEVAGGDKTDLLRGACL